VLLVKGPFVCADPLPKRAPRITACAAIRPHGHSFGDGPALAGPVSSAVKFLVKVTSADIRECPKKVAEKDPLGGLLRRRQVICELVEPTRKATDADSEQIRHGALTSRGHGHRPLHPYGVRRVAHTGDNAAPR
jgi:hypothetical protein